MELKFDVFGTTETKIKTTNPPMDINLKGYKCYPTPTEADKGGALLYIKEDCNVKPLPRLDRIMYKPKHLESVFVEICNKNKEYIIIDCIYRRPSMDLQEFNEDFFDPLIENLQSVDKKEYILNRRF